MTVHDLLVALLLPSADDAAEDLAYNVGGGSVARFVALMNADARVLGLDHTHYTTPIGLDTPGNYSSPDDLVRLADYLMRHWPFFQRTVVAPVGDADERPLCPARRQHRRPRRQGPVDRWRQDRSHRSAPGTCWSRRDPRRVHADRPRCSGRRASMSATPARSGCSTGASLSSGWSRPVRAGERFARRPVPYELAPALVVAARGYRTVVARAHERQGRASASCAKLAGPMAKGTVVGHCAST